MICTKSQLDIEKSIKEQFIDGSKEKEGEPARVMPDVAREAKVELSGRLDQVGMTDIEVPVRLLSPDGTIISTPARAEAFVSLDDPHSKGIHMSRLYLHLQETLSSEPLGLKSIQKLLLGFHESHSMTSDSSYIKLNLDYMIERAALVSSYKGWRSYPVSISGWLENGHIRYELAVQVAYSSTCPCSAALARQIIQENFKETFGLGSVSADQVHQWLGTTEGISATPHSQRSYAEVKVRLEQVDSLVTWLDLINLAETSLGTPVQTVVKREDEQEFAKLNGQNLMFCEDAARKLKQSLLAEGRIADFWIKVNHVESLHPHNAVSIVTKGVPGGYHV